MHKIKIKRASLYVVLLAPTNVIDLTNEMVVELTMGRRRLSIDVDTRTIQRN